MVKIMAKCVICKSDTLRLYDPQLKIYYQTCDTCQFIYKEAEYHVSNEAEHNEYKQHNNSFESTGYVKMFERFIDEFITPLNIQRRGLEYGSGPGPVLYELLRRKGIEMSHFDPFFHPDQTYKNNQYQLITSTEVVEHFTNPLPEFEHLVSLLEPNGYLVLMTNFNMFTEKQFLNWWYRRDKTHISFYHPKTFTYIESLFPIKIVTHNNKNVIVFQKEENQ